MENDISALNFTTIESLRELQSPEDPDFLARLMQTFLKHSEEQLISLDKAIELKDVKKIGEIFHGLKSSCRGVGGDACGGLAAEIEAAALSGEALLAAENFSKFKTEFFKLKQEVLALPEMSELLPSSN